MKCIVNNKNITNSKLQVNTHHLAISAMTVVLYDVTSYSHVPNSCAWGYRFVFSGDITVAYIT